MSAFSHGGPLQGVLVYLMSGQRVLLARKIRHLGAGLWNGYGGRLEPGEQPVEAALRELEEEAGIILQSQQLEMVGILDAQNYFDQEGQHFNFHMQVTLFLGRFPSPFHVRATEEMSEPRWFSLTALPFDQMIPSDADWLPSILLGEKIYAVIHNGPCQKTRVFPTEIYPLESVRALSA